jgi:large subunit ribosomal protein L27
MAHKKAAGSAKNLRDSQPKYRGVKIFGGQTVTKGAIILRQKGDEYKVGSNTYKGRDYTIHASVDGVVRFGKKKFTRYDGRKYLKTYVEVVGNDEQTAEAKVTVKKTRAATKKAPAKAATKTATADKAPAAKRAPAKKAASSDFSAMTVKDLKEAAKKADIAGYSTMKKADLVSALESA